MSDAWLLPSRLFNENMGHFSNGKLHWIADSKNSSAHDSSNRITFKCKFSIDYIHHQNDWMNTWSRNDKFAKEGRFFAHLTAINNNLADVSYIDSELHCINALKACSEVGYPKDKAPTGFADIFKW